MVYIDDEWSYLMFTIWVSARTSTGFGISIDAQIVFEYAKEHKQNKIETLEIVKMIQSNIKERSS